MKIKTFGKACIETLINLFKSFLLSYDNIYLLNLKMNVNFLCSIKP